MSRVEGRSHVREARQTPVRCREIRWEGVVWPAPGDVVEFCGQNLILVPGVVWDVPFREADSGDPAGMLRHTLTIGAEARLTGDEVPEVGTCVIHLLEAAEGFLVPLGGPVRLGKVLLAGDALPPPVNLSDGSILTGAVPVVHALVADPLGVGKVR